MHELVQAAITGNLGEVQRLLPHVEDIRFRCDALHRSVALGNLDVARYLLKAGVPPDHESYKRDQDGAPLFVAVARNNPEAVALLLGAGARHDSTNRYGYTPLCSATSMPVIRLLLDAGADINGGSSQLLNMLVYHDHDDLVREVLRLPGVDPNVKDADVGRTPLHHAVLRKNVACVAALLGAGADPCSKLKVLGHGTPLTFLAPTSLSLRDSVRAQQIHRIATLMVAAGDRSWHNLPTPCPGLEAALVPIWEKVPEESVNEELRQLFQRLEPVVQARLRETLRALHHGGLDKPLRMMVMKKVFE